MKTLAVCGAYKTQPVTITIRDDKDQSGIETIQRDADELWQVFLAHLPDDTCSYLGENILHNRADGMLNEDDAAILESAAVILAKSAPTRYF